MTDRPIIFSAPMVCALLAGTKTQTRRVLCEFNPDRDPPSAGPYFAGHKVATWTDSEGTPWRYPGVKGAVTGDRLWVREQCAIWGKGPGPESVEFPVIYAADDPEWEEIRQEAKVNKDEWKVRTPIHMPRWASRLTLTVTDVRVHRLQEISESDAVAEGADPVQARMYPELGTCRHWYRDLWNSLYGHGAWAANPWVVAITFTVQRGNIDKVPA